MERVLKENASQDSANSKRVAQGKFAPDYPQGDLASRINNSPQMIAQRKKLQGLFGGAAQLQGAEDETLQGKFGTAQRVEEEEPLQGKFEAVQRVEEEEPLQGKFAAVQRVEEEEPLQGKFAPAVSAQLKEETAAKPNNTGLPDHLKSGIESLSGLSMDNVKVHYNSSRPAQLNALAYAQGSDIHVAPGQEQHLPHEAWHVVQQAQGRVQPTMQMKDGVAVNDDVGLEREADVMGGIALSGKAEGSDVTQRVGNAMQFEKEPLKSPASSQLHQLEPVSQPKGKGSHGKHLHFKVTTVTIKNTLTNARRFVNANHDEDLGKIPTHGAGPAQKTQADADLIAAGVANLVVNEIIENVTWNHYSK